VFGLDQHIASFSDGTTLLVVVAVAVLLGLRHATDPDHLAAVTTLVASGRERVRGAAVLGSAWGIGHALSLFVLGVPIILFKAYLPESVERGAETLVGLMIVGLAAWLLVRWKRGVFHSHTHVAPTRSPLQAFAIGLVHGIGGSAGVGVLLLAAIPHRGVALIALGLFAFCTAVSMAALSTGVGMTLATASAQRCFVRVAPAFGAASLLFGLWYVLGAQGLAPYYF
jgi:hypothetical protein